MLASVTPRVDRGPGRLFPCAAGSPSLTGRCAVASSPSPVPSGPFRATANSPRSDPGSSHRPGSPLQTNRGGRIPRRRHPADHQQRRQRTQLATPGRASGHVPLRTARLPPNPHLSGDRVTHARWWRVPTDGLAGAGSRDLGTCGLRGSMHPGYRGIRLAGFV